MQSADTTMDGRLDAHDTDIANLQQADTTMDGRLDGHDTDISALQQVDTVLDGRLDAHDTDISNLQQADTTLDSRLDGHDTDISNLQQGGYRSVADITERDAIPTTQRKEGMLVKVLDGATYGLVGGVANSNWAIMNDISYNNKCYNSNFYTGTIDGFSAHGESTLSIVDNRLRLDFSTNNYNGLRINNTFTKVPATVGRKLFLKIKGNATNLLRNINIYFTTQDGNGGNGAGTTQQLITAGASSFEYYKLVTLPESYTALGDLRIYLQSAFSGTDPVGSIDLDYFMILDLGMATDGLYSYNQTESEINTFLSNYGFFNGVANVSKSANISNFAIKANEATIAQTVASGAITTPKIADKNITYDKVDLQIAKSSLTNLFNSKLNLNNRYTIGATLAVNATTGILEITSSTTYGAIYNSFTLQSDIKSFMFIGKVRSQNSNVRTICYNYNSTGGNLGEANGGLTTIQNPSATEFRLLKSPILTPRANTTRIDIGVLIPTNGGFFELYPTMYLVDTTGLTQDDIDKIDYNTIFESGSNIPVVAAKALLADRAKIADSVEVANKVLGKTLNLTNLVKDTAYMQNGATVNSATNGTINYTNTATWSSAGFTFPNTSGNKYVVISEITNVGSVNAGNLRYLVAYNDSPTGIAAIATNGEQGTGVTLAVGATKKEIIKFTSANTKTGVSVTYIAGTVNAQLSVTQKAYDVTNIDTRLVDLIDWNNADSYNGMLVADLALSVSETTTAHADTATVATYLAGYWKDKNVLAIGDSLTAAQQWQLKVASIHGCTVTTHAKGGIGIVTMVDGNGSDFPALSVSQVTGKDLIIFFGGMNERSKTYGQLGDLYPTQNTIYGCMQYAINKIYDLLTQANNLTCKILIVLPHCPGKYNYVDADGYAEYPVGTGQNMEQIINHIKIVAQKNNIHVTDLYHNSGINKFTWSVYTASSTAVANPPLTGTPYPNNADQLHLNNTYGYPRIGEVIAREMNLI